MDKFFKLIEDRVDMDKFFKLIEDAEVCFSTRVAVFESQAKAMAMCNVIVI